MCIKADGTVCSWQVFTTSILLWLFVGIDGCIVTLSWTFSGNQLSDLRNVLEPLIVTGTMGTWFLIAVRKAPFLNFKRPFSLRNVASGKNIIESFSFELFMSKRCFKHNDRNFQATCESYAQREKSNNFWFKKTWTNFLLNQTLYSFQCLFGCPQGPKGCQNMCHYPFLENSEIKCLMIINSTVFIFL